MRCTATSSRAGDRRPPWGPLALAALAAVSALLFVGCDLFTFSELGTPTVTSTFQQDIVLTADQPVAVRTVAVDVDPAGTDISTVSLHLNGWVPSNDGLRPRDLVWVSIFEPGSGAPLAERGLLDGMTVYHDLTSDCATRVCHQTFVLVVRWVTPRSGDHLTFPLTGELAVLNSRTLSVPAPKTLTVAVVDDPSASFNGNPATLAARISRQVQLTAPARGPVTHLELRIPAAALHGPLAFPLSGRLIVRPTTTSPGDQTFVDVTVRTPHGERSGYGFSGDDEWLSACRPDVDCVVPIDVTPYLRTVNALPADGTSADGSWLLEARLELLSPTGSLPDVPLTLEEVAP